MQEHNIWKNVSPSEDLQRDSLWGWRDSIVLNDLYVANWVWSLAPRILPHAHQEWSISEDTLVSPGRCWLWSKNKQHKTAINFIAQMQSQHPFINFLVICKIKCETLSTSFAIRLTYKTSHNIHIHWEISKIFLVIYWECLLP